MTLQTKSESFQIQLEDHLVLRGNVHGPKQRSEAELPVIVICHGFKGFKDWNFFPHLANQLAMNGFYAIRFNFSHNGVGEAGSHFDELDKFAVNTYSREQADLVALLNEMVSRNLPFSHKFNLKRIGLVGHSRGGANSIIFAAEHPEIRAVVTWNGVSNVDFFTDDLKREIRENGVGYIVNARTKEKMPLKKNVFEDIEQNKQRFHVMSHLKRMSTPVHIIQGDSDSEWLVTGAKKMQKTAPIHSLAMISGGDHTFNAVHPLIEIPKQLQEAMKETIQFFNKRLM